MTYIIIQLYHLKYSYNTNVTFFLPRKLNEEKLCTSVMVLLFIQSSVQSFESDQIAELYIALYVWVGGEGLWSNE